MITNKITIIIEIFPSWEVFGYWLIIVHLICGIFLRIYETFIFYATTAPLFGNKSEVCEKKIIKFCTLKILVINFI